MDSTFSDLARAVASASTFEELARNLLMILGEVSRLDSVFMTRTDAELVNCEIVYSRNTQRSRMEIPEGLVVPWNQAPCRSALAEGIRFVQKVDDHWDNLQIVHDLNLCTYAVEPIMGADGRLLGTLCAVSARRLPMSEQTQQLMCMISQLLGYRMGRSDPLPAVQANLPAYPEARAYHAPGIAADPLTGLTNRAGLEAATARLLTQSAREGGRVSLAFVDVTDFEVIDEINGHEGADEFLGALAERLGAALRPGEVLARVADREFAVVALVPPAGDGAETTGEGLIAPIHERLFAATAGRYMVDWAPIDYRGAGVGVVEAKVGDSALSLLRRMDQALGSLRPVEPPNAAGDKVALPSRNSLVSFQWDH